MHCHIRTDASSLPDTNLWLNTLTCAECMNLVCPLIAWRLAPVLLAHLA
eukprot:COSAG02_NODE_22_length_53020_cov_16.223125_52_plen_49_part_00